MVQVAVSIIVCVGMTNKLSKDFRDSRICIFDASTKPAYDS